MSRGPLAALAAALCLCLGLAGCTSGHGPDRVAVPDVRSLTATEAERVLTAQGFAVDVQPRVRATCRSAGYVEWQRPEPGVEADTVTIWVPEPSGRVDCAGQQGDDSVAHALIRYVRGVGPAPSTEPIAVLHHHADAGMLAATGPQADLVRSVVDAGPLRVVAGRRLWPCHPPEWLSLPERARVLAIAPGATERDWARCREGAVLLVIDRGGTLRSLDVLGTAAQRRTALRSVPDLDGLTQARATRKVTRRGLEAAVRARPRCAPRGTVLGQSAYTDIPVGSPVTLTVAARSARCTGAPVRAARALQAFALGESSQPPVADRVELFLGSAYIRTITAARARDQHAWDLCPVSGYAEATCPFSALRVLREHRDSPEPGVEPADRGAVRLDRTFVPRPSACTTILDPTPTRWRARSRWWNTVTIQPADGSVSSCMSYFSIQVVSDSAGRIRAVNLLSGTP